jgi:hypothetical protein
MATRKSAAKPAATTAGKRTTKTAAKAGGSKSGKAEGAVAAAPKTTSAPKASPQRAMAVPSSRQPEAAPAPGPSPTGPAAPSGEARYRWIAHAAYLRAEKRGFAPGHEVEDWLAAEADFLAAHGLKQG